MLNWIKLTNKTPREELFKSGKKKIKLLLYCSTGVIRTGEYGEIKDYMGNFSHYDFLRGDNRYTTHWMLLPKPPID